jgi:protein phosphatase
VFSSFGLSDVGCVRSNNEDSFLVDPELGLYIVADGMGGAEAGEVASQLAVQSVHSFLKSTSIRDADTLVRAIEAANQRIYDAANADPRLKGMGTTMVCLLETGRDGIIANVGDSRAWRLLGETLEQLTQDQSWVNEVGRPLGISEENLRVHPMRHVLTMALGVGPEVRVQVFPVEMPPGSLVLLSSDGLHGVISEEEIRETLLHPISLEHRAHLLIEAAKDAGGPDNITVVLIQH